VNKKEEKRIVPNKIGLKWKNVGVKKPNGGIEIINKKLINAFYKLRKEDSEVPFYVLFNEEDFAKFGITDITKNSYINIATYYIPFINKSINFIITFNIFS
jgi:hypothetical protein